MKRYVGTKYLKAKPMTLGEYNAYRGWQIPADEDATKPGYLVEYEDGGAANHAGHAGYISWSPADVFERTYKAVPEPKFAAPHQQRVSDEKDTVSGNLGRLLAFFQQPLFASLPEAEQARLRSQARFMDGYAAVLEERIAAFPEQA